MPKQNQQLFNDIANEIKDYSNAIAKEMAIKAREDIFQSANEAITKFYNHYQPKFYNRHSSPFISYNIRKSIKKYYHAPHGNVFSGGIELSPESMDNIYKIRTDYIFNLIMAGYHGNIPMLFGSRSWGESSYSPSFIANVPPIMEPSPLDIILNKRDNLIKNAARNANKIALQLKDKNGYKYIK